MIKGTFDNMDWVGEHIRTYLETDGREGHDIDMEAVGGKPGATPSLLLKTIGRKSGQAHILPLIYGKFGDEYAIIASKGGAPAHPAWFLNIEASDEVAFQVKQDHFIGTWRVAEGDERDSVWAGMVDIYPPYTDYAEATDRHIPVVLLKPTAKTDRL